MSNEITIGAKTGLTVTVQMYNGTTAQGSPIATTEIGTTGVYVGSVPNGTPYGQYSLVALSSGSTIASGQLNWDGKAEIPIGLMRIAGFDPSNPALNTPTLRQSGDISLQVTGYGTNSTTVQRI
jgi:hypothetical protein